MISNDNSSMQPFVIRPMHKSPRAYRFPQITGEEIDIPRQVSASTVLELDELALFWGVDEAFSRLLAST